MRGHGYPPINVWREEARVGENACLVGTNLLKSEAAGMTIKNKEEVVKS